jgi:hypothetical protein
MWKMTWSLSRLALLGGYIYAEAFHIWKGVKKANTGSGLQCSRGVFPYWVTSLFPERDNGIETKGSVLHHILIELKQGKKAASCSKNTIIDGREGYPGTIRTCTGFI